MSLSVGVHVTKSELREYVGAQCSANLDEEICEDAVRFIYPNLSLDDDCPYTRSFIEAFIDASLMVKKGLDFEESELESIINTEDIFTDEGSHDAPPNIGELMFSFCVLLIDYLTIERDMPEILDRPLEFVTLFHSRFDFTFR